MVDAGPVPPVTDAAVYHAQVRWSDADTLGHINHARFLTYFEDARMRLMAATPSGVAGGAGDRGYIAARIAVDFLAPVVFDPGLMLRVETAVGRIGTSSWTFDQRMYEGERPVARCECVLVAYSYAGGGSRPLDPDERAYLAGLAGGAGAGLDGGRPGGAGRTGAAGPDGGAGPRR